VIGAVEKLQITVRVCGRELRVQPADRGSAQRILAEQAAGQLTDAEALEAINVLARP
jgi:hypothetical protein